MHVLQFDDEVIKDMKIYVMCKTCQYLDRYMLSTWKPALYLLILKMQYVFFVLGMQKIVDHY